MKTQKTNVPILPPYPRLGEIYRILALALDTKGCNREIDRMARDGDFDWSLLPKLLDELFDKPLRKYIDADFADLMMDHIGHFQKNYISLLASVSLASVSREQALPLLIKHFFTVAAAAICDELTFKANGIELLEIVFTKKAAIGVVLHYFEADCEVSIAKFAYPSSTGSDKTGREMLLRWEQGKQLPEFTSIKLLTDKLSEKGFDATKLRHLPRCLLLARALSFLEEKSPIPIREAIAAHLVQADQSNDVEAALTSANFAEGQNFARLKPPASALYDRLLRTSKKSAGDQAQIKEDLDAFEQLANLHDPDGHTNFHIEWMKARWHILGGQLEAALQHYEQACEASFYRAGPQQKDLMQETLALAARLGRKPLLKRLKHRAIVFGLLPAPQETDLVQEWEIEQFKQFYSVLFPPAGRFPEAEPENGEVILPMMACSEEEIAKLQPNLRKPNQIVTWRLKTGHVRRHPQLRLFASFGRTNDVAALLARGADVNQLDEANGSALLCALQRANDKGDRSTLDLLLAAPHSAKTLNQATIKNGQTPLQVALDYGEPDVIEKLLVMGAQSELRFDKTSPLYDCVGKFIFTTKPQWAKIFYSNRMLNAPDAKLKESIRRYSGGMTGLFGGLPEDFFVDPTRRQIFDEIIDASIKIEREKHTIAKLTRITEALLQYKAQPNARHSYPEPGRTPLMLAAELDALEAFALMLNAGGDPYIKDDAGQDCLRIAASFGSRRVLDFMRAKGIC